MKIYRIAQEYTDSQYYADLAQEFEDAKKNIALPQAPCPIIDGLITSSKEIEYYAKSIQKSDSIDEMHDLANSIEYRISEFYDNLEQIRSAYETMNDSSKSWYQEAKRLMGIIETQLLPNENL